MRIAKKIYIEGLSIFLVFGVTFLLYPSIIFQGNLKIYDLPDWNIFIYNLSYSVGDFLGRTCGRIRHNYHRAVYALGSIIRLVLIATTFLIAFEHDNDFWSNSAVIVMNTFLIGFSNGFLCVAAGNSFPDRLEDDEKEFGGFFISCLINLGIAIGSLISLVGFKNLFWE